jgi:N-glycosylase/DNA lyase
MTSIIRPTPPDLLRANLRLMKALEVAAPDFDLALTLDSGQTFHWESLGDGFVGAIGERAVYVEQCGRVLKVHGGETPSPALGTNALPGVVARYFSLDHPLAKICAGLPNDDAMQRAVAYCRGLRIMRQPLWECLATFICSSMKQVVHIRQISGKLRQRFGRRIPICGIHVYDFPPSARLAGASEKELRDCGLGYRAKNLLATAQRVASGQADLEAWRTLPDEELRRRLCDLPGVGAKVANCVMLFAYERLRAFPIDVWVERVLREKYFPRRRKFRPGELQRFSARHFGEHGGYAQQYLFHHARKTARCRLATRAR